MAEISVGSVSVKVVPNLKGFFPALRAALAPVDKFAADIGDKFGKEIAVGIKKGIGEGMAGAGTQAKRAGGSSGEDFGGSFARSAKTRIEAALKSLPKAEIGVATSRADQKLKDLRAELQSLLGKNIGIDISDLQAIAKIDDLQVRLAELAATSPSVQVQVDTLGASAQLLAFRTELAALTSGGGGGGAGSVGSVAKLPGLFSGIATSIASAASSAALLAVLAGVIAVALIPVVASVAGLAAALVLPVAAAGGGLTLFAILAGNAISNTLKTGKAIDDLREKAKTLNDPAAAAAALAQADALEKSLTGPQRAFLKAKETLSGAFKDLLGGKAGQAIFAPIVGGMNLLAKILPAVEPVIISVSKAISTLIGDLDKSASGGGFKSFIQGFADLAGDTIVTAGRAIGTFGKGLFNIFRDFLPLSKSVGEGIQGLADKFLAFSQKDSTKEGIGKFISYVQENGPKVAQLIGTIVDTIVQFAITYAPLGAKLLTFFDLVVGGLGVQAQALRPIFELIGTFFSSLGSVFAGIYNGVIGPVFAGMLTAIAAVARGAGLMLQTLGKVPGFEWAKKLGDDLLNTADNTDTLADAIRHLPSVVAIKITGISQAAAQVGTLLGDLGKLDGLNVRATVRISQTGANLGSIIGQIGRIGANAKGTDNWRGGLTLVGEEGPELVNLQRGAQVYTAKETRGILADGPSTSGSDSSKPDKSGLTQNIYPQPGQSEESIGRASANRFLWAMT